MITSFDRPIRAVVVGARGAIGGALVERLVGCDGVETILACSRTPVASESPKVIPRAMDILDESSIAGAFSGVDRIDLAIVATGRLHGEGGLIPEKSWRSLDKAMLIESFTVNAIGPSLVAKHALPLLPRQGKSVFAALSARVGSIGDNRIGGWYGYRASKAALNQLIRTFSIELARKSKDAICIGLHPGTVDSALSRPFQSNVREDRLFTPEFAADRLLTIIDSVNANQSGQCLAWDGSTIMP